MHQMCFSLFGHLPLLFLRGRPPIWRWIRTCFYIPVGSCMSSSFSSASSSSLFSYAYAFVAASLFSASFGHILKTLDGIFSSFWQPLGTLGATLGAIGHHLGNLVDPRVNIGSSFYPHGQLRFQFCVHLGAAFSQKSYIFFKNASHNNPTIKSSFYLFFSMSVSLGP